MRDHYAGRYMHRQLVRMMGFAPDWFHAVLYCTIVGYFTSHLPRVCLSVIGDGT
jgi:hypothetical protein